MYNTVSVCMYVVYKCIYFFDVRMNKHLILYIFMVDCMYVCMYVCMYAWWSKEM
jgi:hypothetical protein